MAAAVCPLPIPNSPRIGTRCRTIETFPDPLPYLPFTGNDPGGTTRVANRRRPDHGDVLSADLDRPPTMRTKRRVLAAVLLLPLNLGVLAEGSKALAAGAAGRLKPCHVPGVDEEVRCGRYEVYENRAARKGRKIGLNIVVLPAKGSEVAADPLVFLAGGGVAPATSYAAFLK